MRTLASVLLLLVNTFHTTYGFAPIAGVPNTHHAINMVMQMTAGNNDSNSDNEMSRRKVISDAAMKTASIAAVAASIQRPSIAIAAEEGEEATTTVAEAVAAMGTDSSHPISIIGAGGKVGTLCTDILNKKGLYTRAITRSGRKTLDGADSKYLTFASGDVTNYDLIKQSVEGSSGVIFAASASGKKKGGDPEHVDYLGLYNTAKACLECGVPKLVVVSAGSVTRPDFVGFKATNLFVKYVYGEKIMDYKIAGEEVMRDLYANQNQCAYCVVRPGGLSDSSPEGPNLVHISQGDVYSSEITRQDVAEVTVAALLKGKSTDFTTFELNQQKGLNKVSKDLETPPSELVHTSAKSYNDLLDGLFTDSEMKAKFPQYMNDFKGDKIKPISQVV